MSGIDKPNGIDKDEMVQIEKTALSWLTMAGSILAKLPLNPTLSAILLLVVLIVSVVILGVKYYFN